MTQQLLNRQQVSEVTSLGKTTIYKLIKAGQFPQPRRLSAQRVGWLVEEVKEWAAARSPSKHYAQ